MPIFEYRCPECGRRFEALLSRAEADESQACPRCGAAVGGKDRPEDRLLSVFAATVVGAPSGAAAAAGEGCGNPNPAGGCGSTGGMG